MSFLSLHYIGFLAVVVAAYYLLPLKLRNLLLLLASYYFYLQAGAQYVVYILATTAITYGSGLLAEKIDHARVRKAVQVLTLVSVLSFLLIFKYAAFFAQLFNGIFSRLGVTAALPVVWLTAPLGISYYTFSAVGYTLDVYNNRVPTQRNAVDYALYISFFPQISLGPIPRSHLLLPQFKTRHDFCYRNLVQGFQRFLWGFFKEAVIAAWLNLMVNSLYADAAAKTGLTLMAAAMLYMIMLYMDFSGYTDMAQGAAGMLGFRLTENFAAPFFATSITEFWSRWHMSLTGWLRDYIYIPLGGNRKGYVRKLVNILLVFLISGLWHQASYNYLVWGGLYGLLRVAEDVLGKIIPKREINSRLVSELWNGARRFYVFFASSVLFVFFRVTFFGDAVHVITHMFWPLDFGGILDTLAGTVLGEVRSTPVYVYFVLLVLALCVLAVALVDYFMIYKAPDRREDKYNVLRHMPTKVRWLFYYGILAVTLLLGMFGQSGFEYIRF